MKVMHERIAGTGVHKDMIKVAIRSPGEKRRARKTEVLTFRTFYGVLVEVARELRRRGVTHVAMEASCACTAEDFAAPAGWQADLVTICRAFHWLDQAAVLARLDSQVAPDGAVAIFDDNSLWNSGTAWARAVRGVVQDFLGEQRRAGGGTFQHHNRPCSQIMEESPFNLVEEHTVPVRRTWTADAVMGYLYSTSFAAPALFGGRLEEFDTAARDVLAGHCDDGQFTEDNEFLIRIGRRGTP